MIEPWIILEKPATQWQGFPAALIGDKIASIDTVMNHNHPSDMSALPSAENQPEEAELRIDLGFGALTVQETIAHVAEADHERERLAIPGWTQRQQFIQVSVEDAPGKNLDFALELVRGLAASPNSYSRVVAGHAMCNLALEYRKRHSDFLPLVGMWADLMREPGLEDDQSPAFLAWEMYLSLTVDDDGGVRGDIIELTDAMAQRLQNQHDSGRSPGIP